MMALAASTKDRCPSEATASGRAASMASTGMRQPITPVELGSTWRPCNPSAPATASHQRSAIATPSGAHTLETLLFTTTAPTVAS